MAGLAVVTLEDLKASELHGLKANPAVLAELYELFSQQMQDALGEPVASRDPLRPGYVPISEVGASEDPWGAEDQIIAHLDAEREFGGMREEIQRTAFRIDDKADDGDVDTVSEELLERLATTPLGAQTCNADEFWGLVSPPNGYDPDPGDEYNDDWEGMENEQDLGCLCIDCRGRKDVKVERVYDEEEQLPDFVFNADNDDLPDDTDEIRDRLELDPRPRSRAGNGMGMHRYHRYKYDRRAGRRISSTVGEKQYRGPQWAKNDVAALRARKSEEHERSNGEPDPWGAFEALLWDELRELIREMRQDEEDYFLLDAEIQEIPDLFGWSALDIWPLDPCAQDVSQTMSECWLAGMRVIETERLIGRTFLIDFAA